jgi:hypothetical protein
MHEEAVADQTISLAAEIAGRSMRMASFGVNRCRSATFSQPKDVRLCRYPEGRHGICAPPREARNFLLKSRNEPG